MGMDWLNVLFRLERRFSIEISRDEFFQAFPGAAERRYEASRLLDLVVSKLPGEVIDEPEPAHVGATLEFESAAWDWLTSQFPGKRQTDFVPQLSRSKWREFEAQGVRPPPLNYGDRHSLASLLQLLGGIASLAVYISLFLSISHLFHRWGWTRDVFAWGTILALLPLLLLLLCVVLFAVHYVMATQPAARTMFEFAQDLAQYNVRFFAKRVQMKLTRDDVWKLIRSELSDVLGIDEEIIHPDSDLVKDLGAE